MASEAGPSFELSSFLITFLMTLVPRGALDGARDRPRTRIQFRLVARVPLSSAKKKNVSCPCLGAPPSFVKEARVGHSCLRFAPTGDNTHAGSAISLLTFPWVLTKRRE